MSIISETQEAEPRRTQTHQINSKYKVKSSILSELHLPVPPSSLSLALGNTIVRNTKALFNSTKGIELWCGSLHKEEDEVFFSPVDEGEWREDREPEFHAYSPILFPAFSTQSALKKTKTKTNCNEIDMIDSRKLWVELVYRVERWPQVSLYISIWIMRCGICGKSVGYCDLWTKHKGQYW